MILMFTTVNKTGSDCQFEGHTICNRCASDIDADDKNKSHDTLGVDQRDELERAKYRGCSSPNDLDRLNPALLGTACFLSGFALGSFFLGSRSLKQAFPKAFPIYQIMAVSSSVYPAGLLVSGLWSRFKPTLEFSSHLEDWDGDDWGD